MKVRLTTVGVAVGALAVWPLLVGGMAFVGQVIRHRAASITRSEGSEEPTCKGATP